MSRRLIAQYITMVENSGKHELAKSINGLSTKIHNKIVDDYKMIGHQTWLLFGNIQSGKTSHVFGIINQAADLGFSAFIMLTADNNILYQQTLERAKSELSGLMVCGENDSTMFTNNSLEKPVLVVLKKNVRILRLWTNVIGSTNFMTGNGLFIVDDEADAASLNTCINLNHQSPIFKYIMKMKQLACFSLYLQVTGTPQSLFLQEINSNTRPDYYFYFHPGNGYLGGNVFFPHLVRIVSPILIKPGTITRML